MQAVLENTKKCENLVKEIFDRGMDGLEKNMKRDIPCYSIFMVSDDPREENEILCTEDYEEMIPRIWNMALAEDTSFLCSHVDGGGVCFRFEKIDYSADSMFDLVLGHCSKEFYYYFLYEAVAYRGIQDAILNGHVVEISEDISTVLMDAFYNALYRLGVDGGFATYDKYSLGKVSDVVFQKMRNCTEISHATSMRRYEKSGNSLPSEKVFKKVI